MRSVQSIRSGGFKCIAVGPYTPSMLSEVSLHPSACRPCGGISVWGLCPHGNTPCSGPQAGPLRAKHLEPAEARAIGGMHSFANVHILTRLLSGYKHACEVVACTHYPSLRSRGRMWEPPQPSTPQQKPSSATYP